MAFPSNQDRKRRQRRPTGRESPATIREKFAVAELARELAHELNNPLEALTNLLYLAKSSPNSARVTSMLQEAEDQLARVSTIVRSILALEKGDHEERL